MINDSINWIPFVLLSVALLGMWLPPIKMPAGYVMPVWLIFFLLSIATGLQFHVLTWEAVLSLLVLYAISRASKLSSLPKLIRGCLLICAGVMVLALAMHKFPGFNNPFLVENLRISSDATLYSRHLSFDMAAAGLIMMIVFCSPIATFEWKDLIKKTWYLAIGASCIVLSFGVLANYVKLDVKLPPYAAILLITNLLFTCITEEAFFRGFMQEHVANTLKNFKFGSSMAIMFCAILFGIAHVKGGPTLIALATLAGVCYGFAYHHTKRIEAAILVHFTVNASHFLFFTYPSL